MRPEFNIFTGPKTSRRKFMLGLLFASAAGVAAVRKPREHLDYLGDRKLENLLPKTIGKWNFVTASGLVVPPEDQLVQATYSQLLTRVYSDGQGPPIMLLLAQSAKQTGFLQVHRPEFCYTAGGYSIANLSEHTVSLFGKPLVTVNMEAVAPDGQVEHVVYWTRVGNQVPRSWREQRLAVAMDNIKGIVPDAILARVSIVSGDQGAALGMLDAFIQAMVASVPAPMQRVFTG